MKEKFRSWWIPVPNRNYINISLQSSFMHSQIRREEDPRMIRLYKASTEGCVVTLKSLMEEDPLLLSKISLNPFGETPLHISAMLGHLNFTNHLLSHNPKGPKLAEELDFHKRSPLHLASAEGHTETVQALIEANKGMCFVRDEDGKIPLHYAAMRGRLQVIRFLIREEPISIFEKLDEGETILHLCVQYNQLDALRLLVASVVHDQNNIEFLNSQDQKCGNTILHLAVMLKQIETIKYLVSTPGVKRGANSLNKSGYTAFGMIELLPKDFKSIKILNILQDALELGHQTQQKHDNLVPASSSSSSSSKESGARASSRSWWSKWRRYMGKYDDDWIKDRSGSVMIVATVIATMTFQTAVNPPGGVWQQDTNTTISGSFDCSPDNICFAGTAVLAYIREDGYMLFTAYNSIAFLASLSIIFLLLTGFPVKYRPFMWLLNVAIAGDLTFMALTFMEGIILVSVDYQAWRIHNILFYTWIGIIGIVILLHTIRFVFWAVKKLQSKLKCCRWMSKLCTSGYQKHSATTAHV